jgi:hypothetical protein
MAAGALDTRLLMKPPRFRGKDPEEWLDFQFKFKSYVGAHNHTWLDLMGQCEIMTKRLDMAASMDDLQRSVSRNIYFILAQMAEDRALAIMKTVEKNMAWRLGAMGR